MLAYLLTSSCPPNPGVGWFVLTNVAVLGNIADSITRVKIDYKCYLPTRKFDLTGPNKHAALAYIKYYRSGEPRWLK